MKRIYLTPTIDVVEIELEGAVLVASEGGSTPLNNLLTPTVFDNGLAW